MRYARFGEESATSLDGRPIAVALSLAGWAQMDLAAAIGVSRNVVSLWCRGRRRIRRGRAEEVVEVFKREKKTPPAFEGLA